MIFSLGLIIVCGLLIGFIFNKIKIPSLVGFILLGLLFGPYFLNLIDSKLLSISSELRQIALIIILTRSGLNLDLQSLKKNGRPAILMCFLPATLEIIGVTIASYYLLNLSIFEGMLLGSVLAAVSPAVVSPRMIKLINEGYNEEPKLVLAGASVDDIYVIVLFYSFLGLTQNNNLDFVSIALIPISIILGIILGMIVGFLIVYLLKRFDFNNVTALLIVLSSSFLMVGIEYLLKPYISISSLLSVLVVGIIILFKTKDKAKTLSNSYNNLWRLFEILLFVLVGASVNFKVLNGGVFNALAVLFIGLIFRTLGVLLCLIKTRFNIKEKLFIIISYMPKATVQASIGGIAFQIGLNCGEKVLIVSVLSILLTAPLGAMLIDNLSHKLISKDMSLDLKDVS